MSSRRASIVPIRNPPRRNGWRAALSHLGSWWKRARWVQHKIESLFTGIQVVVLCLALLATFSASNLIYHVLHKPTEVLSPASSNFNKTPVETWRQYAPLFREYSTASISPELLAALAQVESAGNPIASTYWRWRLTLNPFALYQPASSAVGMYQMTDAAFAEAQGYCIVHHTVVANGCPSDGLYSRVVPGHATQLTAVYLDRNITAILGNRRTVSRQQKEELAAIVHLCGTTPAKRFLHRGFHLIPGERCGDHDVAAYLAGINEMKQKFVRLAAETAA